MSLDLHHTGHFKTTLHRVLWGRILAFTAYEGALNNGEATDKQGNPFALRRHRPSREHVGLLKELKVDKCAHIRCGGDTVADY